jgi:hypothetical protein
MRGRRDGTGATVTAFMHLPEAGGSTTGKLAAATNSNLRLPPVFRITRHGRFAGLEPAQSPRAGEANFLLDGESNDHQATVRMVP